MGRARNAAALPEGATKPLRPAPATVDEIARQARDAGEGALAAEAMSLNALKEVEEILKSFKGSPLFQDDAALAEFERTASQRLIIQVVASLETCYMVLRKELATGEVSPRDIPGMAETLMRQLRVLLPAAEDQPAGGSAGAAAKPKNVEELRARVAEARSRRGELLGTTATAPAPPAPPPPPSEEDEDSVEVDILDEDDG